MLSRLKSWFRKPSAIDTLIPEDIDEPLDPRLLAALARVPLDGTPIVEHVETPADGRERFRVQRIVNGVTYEAYAGHDGVQALEAWEAYEGCDKRGVFRFMDRDRCRGTFTR